MLLIKDDNLSGRVHRSHVSDLIPCNSNTASTFTPLHDAFIARATKLYIHYFKHCGLKREDKEIEAFKKHVKANFVRIQFTGIDVFDIIEMKKDGARVRQMTNIKGQKARNHQFHALIKRAPKRGNVRRRQLRR